MGGGEWGGKGERVKPLHAVDNELAQRSDCVISRRRLSGLRHHPGNGES